MTEFVDNFSFTALGLQSVHLISTAVCLIFISTLYSNTIQPRLFRSQAQNCNTALWVGKIMFEKEMIDSHADMMLVEQPKIDNLCVEIKKTPTSRASQIYNRGILCLQAYVAK